MICAEFKLSNNLPLYVQKNNGLLWLGGAAGLQPPALPQFIMKGQAGETDIYTFCRVNEDDSVNETAIILREGQLVGVITMMEVIIGNVPAATASVHLQAIPNPCHSDVCSQPAELSSRPFTSHFKSFWSNVNRFSLSKKQETNLPNTFYAEG